MNPVIGLSLGRIAVGALAVADPHRAAKALQLDAAANPQLSYVTRLFGTREIALGTITVLARGKARRNLVLAGILVDLGDAATAYLGSKDGTISTKAAVAMLVPALGAVGSGFSGLRKG